MLIQIIYQFSTKSNKKHKNVMCTACNLERIVIAKANKDRYLNFYNKVLFVCIINLVIINYSFRYIILKIYFAYFWLNNFFIMVFFKSFNKKLF